jgi:hypothetical protein
MTRVTRVLRVVEILSQCWRRFAIGALKLEVITMVATSGKLGTDYKSAPAKASSAKPNPQSEIV